MNNTTQYGNDLSEKETRQRPWAAIVVSWLRGPHLSGVPD